MMSMKRLRFVFAGLAALVVVVAVLVWWMPASWVVPFLGPRLHGLQLRQVDGTVWHGRADRLLSADGTALGSVEWSLSRRALLGDTELDLSLRQPQLRFQGHMHQLSGMQDEWSHVVLSLDPAMLDIEPWLHAKPAGELQLNIARAVLQGGWPMQIDAAAHWTHAAVHTAAGVATLGDMSAKITGDNGVLQTTLSDDGNGVLHMSGLLTFSPLGWNLQMDLKPRQSDAVLEQWLHTLGSLAADGSVRLGYRGGLAQMHSTPETQ
jgi:general secretion pathway protein N